MPSFQSILKFCDFKTNSVFLHGPCTISGFKKLLFVFKSGTFTVVNDERKVAYLSVVWYFYHLLLQNDISAIFLGTYLMKAWHHNFTLRRSLYGQGGYFNHVYLSCDFLKISFLYSVKSSRV